jgi:SOUL heme-binding protein
MYYFLSAIVIVLILWLIGSYVVIWSIEEPAYTILERTKDYEIREYASYIKAEVLVTGTYDEASRTGFSLIADYIFGNNITKESISMTTPVLEGPKVAQSEKIAMTTPVLETTSDTATRTIAFILPAKYTLETLPKPNNPAVQLIPVPVRKVAVLRFSWYPTESRINVKKVLLVDKLTQNGKIITGSVETARYNPPLSMPLLKHYHTKTSDRYVPSTYFAYHYLAHQLSSLWLNSKRPALVDSIIFALPYTT